MFCNLNRFPLQLPLSFFVKLRFIHEFSSIPDKRLLFLLIALNSPNAFFFDLSKVVFEIYISPDTRKYLHYNIVPINRKHNSIYSFKTFLLKNVKSYQQILFFCRILSGKNNIQNGISLPADNKKAGRKCRLIYNVDEQLSKSISEKAGFRI